MMTIIDLARRTTWVVLALALMVGVAQAEGNDDARDTIKKRFDVNPGGTLLIDLDHGNIEIEPGQDDVVYIEVERIVEARDRDEAKQILEAHELDFDQSGDDVRMRSRFDRERWKRTLWRRGVEFKVEVTIRVPERYNVDFTNGAGNVVIDDLIGDVEGRTGAGNVTIGTVRGPVDVTSGSGNIEVDGAEGRIRINSGAGNVILRRVEGEIRATTGAGNIIAKITSQPDGDSRLESGAGNVTVYLDEDVGVYVDATASVGSASCDYPLRVKGKWMSKSFGGHVNGGGPELTLRSGVGNVALKKM